MSYQPLPYAAAAAATGIIGSAWSSGMIASLSLISCPAAIGLSGLPTTNINARAWIGLYNHGVALMPRAVGGIALAYGYAAYDSYRRRSTSWKGYAVSAVLAVAIVPWTLLTMLPTNDALMALADGGSGGAGAGTGVGTANELIERWAVLNLGRSLFPLAGAVLGFVTYGGL